MEHFNKSDIFKGIDWELLRRFNIIVNSPNFADAADRIKTSHAALLRQINSLEKQLNVRLFVCSAKQRTNELTDEGKVLRAITEKISEIIQAKIVNKVVKIDNQKSDYIKIFTTAGLSTTLLAPIIVKFLQQHKNVKFEIITKMSPVKINIGEIIIRHDFLSQENFKAVKLIDLNLAFYASKNYIKQYGIPQSYDDLVNHKLLTMKYFNILNIDKYTLDQTSFIYIEPYLQSNYIGVLIEMALNDLGIVELPKYHPATKSLAPITTLGQNISSIYAGYLNIADQNKIIYSFINYLKDNIQHD